MQYPRSITLQLSKICFVFFLLVIVLGLFSISRLSQFNKVSAGIADVWLPNTRAIGDLSNFTSDFRAAEGSDVLSATDAEVAAVKKDIATLDAVIAQSMERYEAAPHEGEQADVYSLFKRQWARYRALADDVFALSHAHRKSDANTLYMTTSKLAYDSASDLLDRLTELNIANARAASDRVGAAYQQAVWLIGVAIAIAGGIVAATLFYIRRWISDPILRLADTMHRLVDRDTEIQIEGTQRRDEIGEMARAAVVFRNNAIELMVSQRGLAQQASMLEEKLAAERHLTMLQRNFVSMASHEFRTPLNIIDGHAQRLAKTNGRFSSEDIGERAGKIRGAVQRMTHLMENLLSSSRLVDGDVGLYFHPSEFDLAALLRDVCHLHQEISPKSQIIQFERAESLPMLGDAKLLFQVFSNVLANAIKYSPSGGPIKVAGARAADDLVVTIEDHGIGIPHQDLKRLFERYYRGTNAVGTVGTGLGLYLVKMIVELHGGGIAVESVEGQGSKFTVRLPTNLASQPAFGSAAAQMTPRDASVERDVM
jgi:two-component system, OmpR family, sensor kinase